MSVEHITVDGEFVQGVTVDGVTHRAFTMRLPTLGDNIDAVDEVGATNQLALSTAVYARQLVKLGTLKPSQITFELLRTLHPSDFQALEDAAAQLGKQRQAALAAVATSSGSGSPSSVPV